MTLTPIAILDILATTAFGVALIMALRFPAGKIGRAPKAFLCFGLVIYTSASFCNILEQLNVFSVMKVYESYLELLFLPFVIFFFYSLRTKKEIASRLESEKKLRASRQEYQAILNNIGIGAALLDSEMRIISVNHQIRNWFPELDTSDKPHCYCCLNDPPKSKPCENCPIPQTLKDGLVHEAQTSITRKGETLFFRIIASPLKDNAGKTVGAVTFLDNITGQINSEKHVRMLESAIQQASEGILVLDSDGIIIFANDTLAKMHGFQPGEILGKPVEIFHTPEQIKNQVIPFKEKVYETGLARAELDHIKKDGTIFPTVSSSTLFSDSDGNAIGLVATITDITEKKKTGEALRQSEDKLQMLADTSLDCLWEFDENDIFQYISPRIKEILGYEPEELIGTSLFNLLVPEDLEAIRQTRQEKDFPTSFEQHEARYYHKDGRIIVLDTTGVPFFDEEGKYRGFRGISRDVTMRKQAEDKLQQALDEARALEDIVNHGFAIAWLWKAEEEMPVEFVSDNISQFGYTADDFISGKIKFSDIVHEDDLENVVREVKQHIQANEQEFSQQYRIKTRSGSIRQVEDHTWFRANEAGQITHFQGITIDVTQRMQSEETRQKLELQMQRMQKLESLSILAGGVAHDFNNLLMIITGNADLGLMDAQKDSTQAEILQEIKEAAVRASKLSNQMRAYSGQGHVGMEHVVLNDIVTEMLGLLKSSISKKILLDYNFADNLPEIEADISQMNQVVMNLVINASEAIGDKDGTISIRTDVFQATREYLSKTHLDENLPAGSYVLLEVSDTGCGIDEDMQEKIFDPFFTTKFIGRGLGLAAVIGIIRGHRGAIRVISKPQKGSTFQVLLPISKKATVPQFSATTEKIREWQGHGTVLVVDDEKSFLNVATIILKRSGFDVATAENGQEAINYFTKNHDKVVAVLLDMSMPIMGGEETFAELKKIDETVPVFLCSGFSEYDAAKHFSGGGLAGFLQKPFQIDTLLTALKKIIEQ